MKIFDCFTFFNEFEILDLRLMELYDAVDHFVLVEASKSHTGKDKPYHFEENKARYERFLDKIIHVKVDDLPGYDHNRAHMEIDWRPENIQRNCISRGLEGVAQAGDKIFVSDCDEIWDKRRLTEGVLNKAGPLVFKQAMYYYYVNTIHHERWHGSVLATYGYFKTPQILRDSRCHLPSIENGGWHYSYQGGADNVLIKMQNIAEANLMTDRMGTIDKIADKLKTLQDPLERPGLHFKVDMSYSPTCINEFVAKYPHFAFKGE